MFKKVIKSLSKALGPGAKASETTAPKEEAEYQEAPATSAQEVSAALLTEDHEKIEPTLPPDELCGVTAEMTEEEVREQLAFLYRRYNRATSSLDPQLRAESEMMLDAIVAVREKHFGPI